MKKSLSNRLLLLINTLFDQPLTPTYWLLVGVYLVMGTILIHPGGHMPDLVRHLAIGGIMVGLARLFNTQLGRWAWVIFMSLLVLLVGLDVAILALS